ncbi:MAG: PEP-CTERM sorting domain-containing protein [Verrucomicrobiota bacterium]
MITKKHILPLGAALALTLFPSTVHAAAIITDGQTVGGTMTNLNLSLTASPTGIRPTAGNATLSNDVGGNLLFTPNSSVTSDYFVTWSGLALSTTTYKYVEITFTSVTSGAVNAGWQTFFQDDDSTVGGGSSSGHGIGTGIVGTAPFSVVIDMTALTGGSGGTTGARGWGPGQLDILRFDMFEDTANFGKTFTISQVKLGTQLIPEPSTVLLGSFGMLALVLRRRR